MKTLLLSTVAVLALGGMANATDFVCSAPQFAVGQQSRDKQDTVDGIEIRHASNSPEWQVHHRFQNGTMVMREEQYAMTDASNPNGWAWRGRLKRNSAYSWLANCAVTIRAIPIIWKRSTRTVESQCKRVQHVT